VAQISLEQLRHSYLASPAHDADWALKKVDLQWNDGGAYALLGPSGCGKTTLLNIVSGLLRPTAGRICFGDEDVTDSPPDRRNIAQVFQFPVVYDTMSVYDNLAFPLRNRGTPETQVDARVREIAALLDLGAMLPQRAAGLTADGKQKISLGRGLVRSDVNVIMFDEPLTVIDPHLKWRLRSKLKELHQRIGMTMIYVTHDQTEAMTFAERVVVMHEGTVVQVGTPVELFERPRHTFVGHFIGSPGMNILPCEVDNGVARFAGFAARPALIAAAFSMICAIILLASPPFMPEPVDVQIAGVSAARISSKSPSLFTLFGANSAMSTSPAHSSLCLISSQLLLAPPGPLFAPGQPFVRTSTQDPFSL